MSIVRIRMIKMMNGDEGNLKLRFYVKKLRNRFFFTTIYVQKHGTSYLKLMPTGRANLLAWKSFLPINESNDQSRIQARSLGAFTINECHVLSNFHKVILCKFLLIFSMPKNYQQLLGRLPKENVLRKTSLKHFDMAVLRVYTFRKF